MNRLASSIRVGIGLLLIAAAGLKLYGLGVSAMPSVGWFAQPWIQLAAAEWELVLGLWLISGAYPKASWFAAIGTFLAFAGASGYLGMNGVASCGCLGAVQANPWWAFAVDVVALAMLGCSYPRGERILSTPKSTFVKWIGGIAVLFIGVTLGATAVYGSPEAAIARLRGNSLLVEPHLDLGAGKPGSTLEATAIIRNISDHPIRLFGGTTDCTCTVLRDLPVTISPGESASVGIQMIIPAGETGRLSRKVILRTDDPAQPVLRFAIGCRVE